MVKVRVTAEFELPKALENTNGEGHQWAYDVHRVVETCIASKYLVSQTLERIPSEQPKEPTKPRVQCALCKTFDRWEKYTDSGNPGGYTYTCMSCGNTVNKEQIE